MKFAVTETMSRFEFSRVCNHPIILVRVWRDYEVSHEDNELNKVWVTLNEKWKLDQSLSTMEIGNSSGIWKN